MRNISLKIITLSAFLGLLYANTVFADIASPSDADKEIYIEVDQEILEDEAKSFVIQEDNIMETFATSYDGVTGWVQKEDGNWYYYIDGEMLTNAITPDGYYVGPDGVWEGSTQSGSTSSSDTSAYSGGWVQKEDGKWYYYINGEMLTNAITPDGYYVGPDGAWEGSTQSGSTSSSDSSTYSGVWVHKSDGNWYYYIDGEMLTNAITPDGYYVGPDGVWVDGYQNNSSDSSVYKSTFAEEYQEILNSVTVTQADGNTKADLAKFFESLAPEHDNSISFVVEITDNELGGPGVFIPAIAGTSSNRSGVNGTGGVRIYIVTDSGSQLIAEKLFTIKATPYTISSSSGSSRGSSGGGGGGGGGGSSNGAASALNTGSVMGGPSSGYITLGPILTSGSWETLEDGHLKFICPDGEDAKLQWIFINDNYYYVESSGAMLTGWQIIDGVWYYFDLTTGIMLHDTITPDGYMVGPNGAWIQE